METKKLISLISGILILLILLWFTFKVSNSQGSIFNFYHFEWRIFVLIIASSIFSILGFELIRIGLKSEI